MLHFWGANLLRGLPCQSGHPEMVMLNDFLALFDERLAVCEGQHPGYELAGLILF